MNTIQKEKTISFADNYEYESVKRKLESDPDFVSVRKMIQSFDDTGKTITYLTEEITPDCAVDGRTKVLLLFKNPHPDSVAAGLFLSEAHSKDFWKRLFEVDYNRSMLPMLNRPDWINCLADNLLSGKYDAPFLYYFRCLYPFPTKQFADLQQLFAGAPVTCRREILDKSLIELNLYIKQNGIRNVIVFFKDALSLPGCRPLSQSINAVSAAKEGIDAALASGDESIFWKMNGSFRQQTKDSARFYLNMNTRSKNHGTHLAKRYFTWNLEFILNDIAATSQK